MENSKFAKIKESDNPLKIDKDLVEIQKTVIFYGDRIIFKLDKIIDLLQSAFPNRKSIEDINLEKNKFHEPLVQLLHNMKIPKGYREN
jgi:hypothetical protein